MIGRMDVSRETWLDPERLQDRLRALVAARAELDAMMSGLAVCPYRTGLHGGSAPVLPSPDELRYVASVLDRASSGARHALVTALHCMMEDA